MQFAKIGFLELSSGHNKSAGSWDLETNVLANKSKKIIGKCRFFCFAGVAHFAGVENKRLGPIFPETVLACTQRFWRIVLRG